VPPAAIILKAHKELERLVAEKDAALRDRLMG